MSYQARRILTPRETCKRKERDLASSVGYGSKSSNRLLAGYMAYEFLTQGTLLGQKFEAAGAEAAPVKLAQPRRYMKGSITSTKPRIKVKPDKEICNEVTILLKNDGAHIPNIVNPTQLASWIRMCRDKKINVQR